MTRFSLIVALSLALFVNQFPARCLAEYRFDPAIEAQANPIFSSVMSPFCPGRLLQDCPSSQAHELKEKIKEKIQNGSSVDQIYSYLYTLYGDDIRASPPTSGFGVVAWITPGLFLLLGIGVLVLWIRAKRHSEERGEDEELDPATKEKVEALLQKEL